MPARPTAPTCLVGWPPRAGLWRRPSVPERWPFDYAVVRVVPRIERGEYLNAGVILYCRSRRFLAARIQLDLARLHALAPACDGADVLAHLNVIPLICRGGRGTGPIGALPQPDRWHWLVAPRSTVIQPAPTHGGLSADPAMDLERLAARYLQE
ncbi:MAG: DUF3037 domain-containing protein [Roseiflexaceae bacterium]|nr:DUF3037 domain-containing protein [Roseiflexaceae bacterium]